MKKTLAEEYFDFSKLDGEKFLEATKQTLYMTGISMIFVIIIGIILGLLLYYLSKSSNSGAKVFYNIISIISNICRSVPFIILIILLIPITKLMIGTFLGPTAAIPALVISAAPFYGRLVEIAFREVDSGVLEASEAMGATRLQVIWKVLIPESLPALISGATVTTITMIGFTAMAGAISAGGLGGLAYQDGFMRGNQTVTLFATICILIIVFIIQGIGDLAVKKSDKR
ncbi:methionine ABC transporter permease [Vagococcus salmoninarum]|uniref:Methionine ABC transporter permease n=1 Tax=Vagococcus salmoninarum TaxID=2739 RepID=A0A429ZTM0_9ENTE|nr:methionine ABC transporter permease [Vagococcus salmoninarum]MBE9388448.1 ABC transporter permease [Vagococcus salmoninarum]RST97085.1 methionine ABC transporter permease [Vagococcus salmoninarum]